MATKRVDLASIERAIKEELSVHTTALEQKRAAEEVAKRLEQIVWDTEVRLKDLLSVYEDLGGDTKKAKQWRAALYPPRFRFANMSLKDAVHQVLQEADRAMAPDEIVQELRKGGAALWARSPVVTVRSILWRGVKGEDNLYERVGAKKYRLAERQQMELPLRRGARRGKEGGGSER